MQKRPNNGHNDSDGMEDRLDVLLALALSREKPSTPCLSLDELVAWRDGTLGEKERRRVVAHVAHCESCYESWIALMETDPEGAPAAPRKGFVGVLKAALAGFENWSAGWKLGVAGGGLAAAAVLVLLLLWLPSMQKATVDQLVDSGYRAFLPLYSPSQAPEDWPWPAYQTKDLQAALNRKHQKAYLQTRAFQAGVRSGLAQAKLDSRFWQEVLSDLPQSLPECARGEPGSTCRKLTRTMYEAGRWAVLLHFACISRDRKDAAEGPPNLDAFWKRQSETLMHLTDALGEAGTDQRLQRFFADWAAAVKGAEDPGEALCGRADALMNLGFGQ